MTHPARILIIAGSDSSGGAGIQADIKTVTMLGGYAMTAITAITAQDTTGVHAVETLSPQLVAAQIDEAAQTLGQGFWGRVWNIHLPLLTPYFLASGLLVFAFSMLEVSDSLILAMRVPARVAGVYFFGCNMDPSGTKTPTPSPVLDRCFGRHARDYAALSATPDDFQPFVEAVGLMMATEPNYGARELATVRVPVAIVQSEHDEFIERDHAEYLARSIPGAELVILPDVTHFAPLQRPEQFNAAVLGFLGRVVR